MRSIPDRGRSFETKRAMFWVELVAEYAGEQYLTANRIVTSLLRTAALQNFCARAKIDHSRVLEALERLQEPTFEECERQVRERLAAQGLKLGSPTHLRQVQRRRVEPTLKDVFHRIITKYEHMALSPLELLLEVIRADAAAASLLEAHGLTAEAIAATLDSS